MRLLSNECYPWHMTMREARKFSSLSFWSRDLMTWLQRLPLTISLSNKRSNYCRRPSWLLVLRMTKSCLTYTSLCPIRFVSSLKCSWKSLSLWDYIATISWSKNWSKQGLTRLSSTIILRSILRQSSSRQRATISLISPQLSRDSRRLWSFSINRLRRIRHCRILTL